MRALFQPINQVKFTNVAIVKYKYKGKKFEIACYKNKIIDWRDGVELNIDDVLQSPLIFTNISKGETAKKSELTECFNTDDNYEICKTILEKGSLQISNKERQILKEKIHKEMIEILHGMTVNCQTGYPLSSNMIESMIKNVGYSINIDSSAKKQALKVFDILSKEYENIIERVYMRIQIICDSFIKDDVTNFLKSHNVIFEENKPLHQVKKGDIHNKLNPRILNHSDEIVNGKEGTLQDSSPKNAVKEELNNCESKEWNEKRECELEEESSQIKKEELEKWENAESEEALKKNNLPEGYMKQKKGKKKDQEIEKNGKEILNEKYKIVFLCHPCVYRYIDEFLKKDKKNFACNILNNDVKIATPNQKKNQGSENSSKMIPSVRSENTEINENKNDHKNKNKKKGKSKGRNTREDDSDDEYKKKDRDRNEVITMNNRNIQNGNVLSSMIDPKKEESGNVNYIICTSCLAKIEKTEYKLHCRSDYHVYNVKRKYKNMAPVSLEEYREIDFEKETFHIDL